MSFHDQKKNGQKRRLSSELIDDSRLTDERTLVWYFSIRVANLNKKKKKNPKKQEFNYLKTDDV